MAADPPAWLDDDGYATPKEVADTFRVSRRTVYSMIARGDLPAARVAGQWRIARDAVDDLAAVEPGRRARPAEGEHAPA